MTCYLEVKSAAEKRPVIVPLLENHAGPLQWNWQLILYCLSQWITMSRSIKTFKGRIAFQGIYSRRDYNNKYSNPDFLKHPTNEIKLEKFKLHPQFCDLLACYNLNHNQRIIIVPFPKTPSFKTVSTRLLSIRKSNWKQISTKGKKSCDKSRR